MFCERFQVKDFGKHAHVDFHINTNIAGILGENFSGKTTMLAALKWLLTNVLDDDNGSYIRNYDPDGPAGQKAAALGVFRHSGRRIQIERTISMSGGKAKSTAELTILSDPEPEKTKISGTSKVDAWLAGFLGLGKRAAASVTFIKQGELAKILEGTSTVRYDTFAKIMDVSFVDASEKVVEKQIGILSKLVVDYGPLLLSAGERVTAAQTAAALAEAAYASADMSYERRLQPLRDLVGLRAQRLNAEGSLQRAETADASLDADCAAFKLKMPDVGAATAQAAGWNIELMNVNSGLSEIERLARLQQRKQQAVDEHTTLTGRVPALVLAPKPGPMRARETELRTLITTLRAEDEKATVRRNSVELYDEQRVKYEAALSARALNPDAPEKLHAEMVEHGRIMQDNATMLTLLSAFTPGVECEEGCPLCRSKERPDPAVIAERAAALKSDNLRRTALSRALFARKQAVEALDKAVADAKYAVDLALTRLNETTEQRDPKDIGAELLAAVNENLQLGSKITDAEAKEKELTNVRARIAALSENIATIDADLAGINIGDDTAALQAKKETLMRDIGAIDVLLKEHDRLASRVRNRSGLVTLRDDYDGLVKKVGAATAALGLPEDVQDEQISAEINRLALLQQHVTGLVAELRAANVVLNAAESELATVKRKIAESATMRRRLDKLREVKTAIRETTSAYLRDVFHKVLVSAQKYLVMMNSPMAVFTNPEDPFEIVFRDLTNETTRPLPQSKLSGAQKVRLSLAFLLALHERVIPEIGFLTLDEPSQNLSVETGVADLRDLLEQLGERLANTGGQLLVIDHQPSLQTVLGSVLRL